MPCNDVKNAVLIPSINTCMLESITFEEEKSKLLRPIQRPANVPNMPKPTNMPGTLFQSSVLNIFSIKAMPKYCSAKSSVFLDSSKSIKCC